MDARVNEYVQLSADANRRGELAPLLPFVIPVVVYSDREHQARAGQVGRPPRSQGILAAPMPPFSAIAGLLPAFKPSSLVSNCPAISS